MSVLISKVNKSVKFIIALGIFALILSLSIHVVKADTYYPVYVKGFVTEFSGSATTYSPISSTSDYSVYNILAQYPCLKFNYTCVSPCTLNLLINCADVSTGGFDFGYYSSSSDITIVSSLITGNPYTFIDYYGNIFKVVQIGSTLTLTCVIEYGDVNFFFSPLDCVTGDIYVYGNYYYTSDSSSTDYTSLLSSIYNHLVALNTDTDTMISYLNTIINNLVSLNADTDTIISELNTIESLIGSTSDSGTILYYLYQISTYTSYTPNIYSLLNAWYQDLVSESEDTSIDEEIESDLAVVEAQVGDSVSAASSSQSDMLSADSDVDDSILSGFDNFDSNIDSITDNISLTSGTGLYSSFGIFSLLFSDVFGISEINTYLYILLFLGIIGTVFGVATKVIGKRGDSGD